MKYGMMPRLMWMGYQRTFRNELKDTLKVEDSKSIMKKAKVLYKEIIAGIDSFQKGDRFLINILSCAMLCSILMVLENKPTLEEVRLYYRNAMCKNALTKLASTKGQTYTQKGRDKLKAQAKVSETNTNPYSWSFSVEDGPTLNQYTAYFHTCGICYLMKELGLGEYIPAMCTLDYDMAKMNHTIFTREHTLAEGGPNCDCHYDHKG